MKIKKKLRRVLLSVILVTVALFLFVLFLGRQTRMQLFNERGCL